MESLAYIYTLSHPVSGEVRYIGKASDLDKRFRNHICPYNDRVSHKRNWINSLLSVGLLPKMEVIDVVEKDEWQFWEQHYIALFKSWGFSLVNATIGGDGNNGYKCRESSKEKLRIANIGKKASEETKLKMRANNKKYWQGKKRSEATIIKFSNAQKGKKVSYETRRKMSERMKGEKHHFFGKKLSDEHKSKLWANRSHVLTDELKLKLSIATKKWWAERKRQLCLAV